MKEAQSQLERKAEIDSPWYFWKQRPRSRVLGISKALDLGLGPPSTLVPPWAGEEVRMRAGEELGDGNPHGGNHGSHGIVGISQWTVSDYLEIVMGVESSFDSILERWICQK